MLLMEILFSKFNDFIHFQNFLFQIFAVVFELNLTNRVNLSFFTKSFKSLKVECAYEISGITESNQYLLYFLYL